MRRTVFLASSAAAVVLLAGCGSDDSGSPASQSLSQASTTAAPSTSASTSTEASSSSAPTSSAASVGAAPAGSSIKSGVASRYPAQLDGYAKQGETGPATIYSKDGNLLSMSFLPSSNYDLIVKNVTQQQTVAGTGVCGSTSIRSNLTCYLRVDDGVLNVVADAGDVPLPDLVSFVNQLTSVLGTS